MAPDDAPPSAAPPGPAANDEALLIRLRRLREEHADLDQAIHALTQRPGHDALAVARLKKRKLRLKETILSIEDMLHPDIIA